jgi:hypothetical protein
MWLRVFLTVSVALTIAASVSAQSLLDKAMQGDSSAGITSAPSQQEAPSAATVPESLSPPNPVPRPALTGKPVGPTGEVGATAPLAAAVQGFGDTFIGRRFRTATKTFPAFCHDWQDKLIERERYNIERIIWHIDHGMETGTYLGYSPINSCTTKLSSGGIPIGKLTYQEINYTVSGKTLDDAKHAKPQQTSVMNTLEIFRWDQTHWLY